MPSLAAALREATREQHTAAERAGIMPSLLRGELPRTAYVTLLQELQAIYAALEAALNTHRAHPYVAPIWNPSLRRGDALAHDIRMLAESSQTGAGAAAAPHLHAATRRYVERIRRVAAEAPHRLAAHAYVRYLGDLSGGQILARIVGDAYADGDGRRSAATSFYDFGSADQVRSLAAALRAGLDALPDDAGARADIVDEARDAFERHRALFIELAQPARG